MLKYRKYYNSKVKTCADLIQKSVDNIILAAAFALLCLSSYYLYFRPYPRHNELNLPPIAKLSRAENTVKYRGYDNFSWENAKGGLPLVQGDSLYTHESSGAQISFNSGPTLSMEPFTLLKISTQDNEFALDLLSGNISAQLSKEGDHITLLLGKRKFRLTGTKAQIKIKKKGDSAQISVLKGQVQISEGTNNQKEFGVSELELSSEQGIPKDAFVFELEFQKLPPDFLKIFPGKAVDFSFKPLEKFEEGPFQVEVENTSLGKQFEFTTQQSTISLENLKPGFHAVKVSQKLPNKTIKSPYLNFNLEFYDPPYFSIPSKELFIEEGKNLIEISLSYDEQEYPQFLKLIKEKKVIKEVAISAVTKAVDTQTIPFTYEFIEDGEYSLELSPAQFESETFKKVIPFTVFKRDSLEAPEVPALSETEVLYQTEKEKPITLTWKRRYENSSFEVVIGNQTFQTSEAFLNIPLDLNNGENNFSWKVREIVGGRKSVYSKEANLKVFSVENFKQTPQTGTKLVLEKPNQLVSFEWSGELIGKEQFEFQVSKNPEFSNPLINKKISEKQTKAALGAKGEYYWRVQITDPKGKIRFGAPVKIQIEPAPPPAPLKLKEKLELKIKRRSSLKQTLFNKGLALHLLKALIPNTFARTGSSFTKLTWPSDNLAKSYILRIYSENNQNKPLIEVEVQKPVFTWENPKPGTYYWEVAIKDFWERIGDYSNRSQLILKGDPIPIDLISPKHNTKISFEDEGETNFRFSEVQKGRILFSKDLSFKAPLFEKIVKGTEAQVSNSILRKLKSDSLYWRVVEGEKKDQRKSLRRKLIFLKKPKPLLKEEPQRDLAKSILPLWKNRIYQKVSNVSADQTGSLFTAEASGLFVNIIGFQKVLNPENGKALQGEIEVGKGVAFNTLDYFQGRLNLTRHSKTAREITKSWSYFYGIEAQYQTSFEEASANTLVSKNNALFGGLVGIRAPFTLILPSEASLEIIYGTFSSYRASLRSHWGSFKGFPFSTQLFLENLKFEDGLNELSRTSLGLAWEFSF